MVSDEAYPTTIKGSGRVTLPGLGTVKVSGRAEVSTSYVRTSGSSRLPGGLKLRELKTSGSTRINGEVEADYIRFRGSAKIEGDARFKEMEKSGSLTVEGDVHGEEMEGSGSTRVRGDVKAENRLRHSGSIKVDGDVESGGAVQLRGGIKIGGRVKARHFEALYGGDYDEVREGVEADTVTIEPSHCQWDRRGCFTTPSIAASGDVVLEGVTCRHVRGGRVILRGGCRVEKLEYTESVEVSPNASISSEPIKIDGKSDDATAGGA